MQRIFGLAPNVFFLGLVSLFNDFSSEMIYAVMPVFLVNVLGAAPVIVGLIDGFADALASVLKIFSGWFSDKTGKRKSISVFGYALSTGTRFFLSLVSNFWQVFILRAIDRVGKGVREAPRDALLIQSANRLELGKSFNYHRMMDTIGGILGPLAAFLLLPALLFDFRKLFVVGFVFGIFSLLAFVFVKEINKENVKSGDKNLRKLTFSLNSFNRQFKMLLASIFVYGLGLMPITLVLLKGQSSGFDGTSIPLMYLIYSVSFAIFAIPFGKLSDRIGEKKVMLSGFLVGIFAYLVFAFTSNQLGTVLGFIIFGLYGSMTDGIGRALASKFLTSEQLATGEGFLQAATGISSLTAGIAGGLIWTYFSASWAFIYGSVFMFLGFLLFLGLKEGLTEL